MCLCEWTWGTELRRQTRDRPYMAIELRPVIYSSSNSTYLLPRHPSTVLSIYLFIYLFCLSACRGPTREGEMYSPNWHVRSLTSSYLSPAPQANNLQAGDIWIHRFSLQYSGLENSLDWIVCEVAELDMTEQLLLSLSRCLLGANGNNPFNALSKNEKKINVFCFVFSINNWESLLQ